MKVTRIPKGWAAEIEKGSEFGLKAKAALTKPAVAARRSGINKITAPGVGACLAKRIANFFTLKGEAGCGCKSLASQMDKWGPDTCEVKRDYIVSRLLENKHLLSQAVHSMGQVAESLLGWIIGTSILDPVFRKGANYLLDESIKEARANLAAAYASVKSKPVSVGLRQKRQRGGFGNPFRNIGQTVRFVKASQFQEDIKTLLGKVPPDITAIAGVARSGLSAATMLSMYLHLPMLTIDQTRHTLSATGNGWRLGVRHVDPKGKILVVDDTVMTGNSLRAISDLVTKDIGEAVYAAVYVNPLASRKPDIWAVDLEWPHLLEWNLFNSILSPSTAVDFDGVLCRDCAPGQDDDGPRYLDFIRNAIPLYTPRRVPIPLIVTARIEKYREETEAWLHRYNIKFHKLVMHPAKSLAERNRDNIPAYKAMYYRDWASRHRPAPGPIMFIESEDWQAREIARQSRLMTVCPHTGGIY